MTTKEIMDTVMANVIQHRTDVEYYYNNGDSMILTQPIEVMYHIPTLIDYYNMAIRLGADEQSAINSLAYKINNDIRLGETE